ncbi:hypothetical protein TIFTF001_035883 [Ficus carica]|uniref:Uncharacterized protein n=1 Tax=Ficus carica TaxID=3494 RepID=A0AA88E2C0_FICCA|nr:hypothetical protein TIFTF001_035883 [Ficus carica]
MLYATASRAIALSVDTVGCYRALLGLLALTQPTDSKNDNLSGDVDVTGSSSSIVSSSSDTTGESAEQGAQTPDNLSGISDIPSPDRSVGPATRLDQEFIEELNGAAKAPPTLVVDLTIGGDETFESTASQASTSGREGSASSESTAPAEEPIKSRGRLVYTANYFTSAVTSQYLESLREEVLSSRATLTFSPVPPQGAPETQHCPDFFIAGRWLHGQLDYDQISHSVRVPNKFRRGLAKYNWFSSSSTSDYPHDRPRTVLPGEVTVASRLPDPVAHYRAWTVVTADVVTTSDRSEVPRGVPVASTHGLHSDSSSQGAWGPRIADKDMDLLLGQLYPVQGLRIEEPTMSDQGSCGSKRLSDQDRVTHLQQKFAKTNKGSKSRAGPSAPSPTSKAPSDPPVARLFCPREDQPSQPEPTIRGRRDDSRPREPSVAVTGTEPVSRKSFAQRAVVSKFDDCLTSEVAESS